MGCGYLMVEQVEETYVRCEECRNWHAKAFTRAAGGYECMCYDCGHVWSTANANLEFEDQGAKARGPRG